jgi:hypothetical protein
VTNPLLTVTTFSDTNKVVQVDYWSGDVNRPALETSIYHKVLGTPLASGPITDLALTDFTVNGSFSFQLVDAAGNLGGGAGAGNRVYCAFTDPNYADGVARSLGGGGHYTVRLGGDAPADGVSTDSGGAGSRPSRGYQTTAMELPALALALESLAGGDRGTELSFAEKVTEAARSPATQAVVYRPRQLPSSYLSVRPRSAPESTLSAEPSLVPDAAAESGKTAPGAESRRDDAETREQAMSAPVRTALPRQEITWQRTSSPTQASGEAAPQPAEAPRSPSPPQPPTGSKPPRPDLWLEQPRTRRRGDDGDQDPEGTP